MNSDRYISSTKVNINTLNNNHNSNNNDNNFFHSTTFQGLQASRIVRSVMNNIQLVTTGIALAPTPHEAEKQKLRKEQRKLIEAAIPPELRSQQTKNNNIGATITSIRTNFSTTNRNTTTNKKENNGDDEDNNNTVDRSSKKNENNNNNAKYMDSENRHAESGKISNGDVAVEFSDGAMKNDNKNVEEKIPSSSPTPPSPPAPIAAVFGSGPDLFFSIGTVTHRVSDGKKVYLVNSAATRQTVLNYQNLAKHMNIIQQQQQLARRNHNGNNNNSNEIANFMFGDDITLTALVVGRADSRSKFRASSVPVNPAVTTGMTELTANSENNHNNNNNNNNNPPVPKLVVPSPENNNVMTSVVKSSINNNNDINGASSMKSFDRKISTNLFYDAELIASSSAFSGTDWRVEDFGGYYVPLLKIGQGSFGTANIVEWKPFPSYNNNNNNNTNTQSNRNPIQQSQSPQPQQQRQSYSDRNIVNNNRVNADPTTEIGAGTNTGATESQGDFMKSKNESNANNTGNNNTNNNNNTCAIVVENNVMAIPENCILPRRDKSILATTGGAVDDFRKIRKAGGVTSQLRLNNNNNNNTNKNNGLNQSQLRNSKSSELETQTANNNNNNIESIRHNLGQQNIINQQQQQPGSAGPSSPTHNVNHSSATAAEFTKLANDFLEQQKRSKLNQTLIRLRTTANSRLRERSSNNNHAFASSQFPTQNNNNNINGTNNNNNTNNNNIDNATSANLAASCMIEKMVPYGPSGGVSSLSCTKQFVTLSGVEYSRDNLFVCKVEKDFDDPLIQREARKVNRQRKRQEVERKRNERLKIKEQARIQKQLEKLKRHNARKLEKMHLRHQQQQLQEQQKQQQQQQQQRSESNKVSSVASHYGDSKGEFHNTNTNSCMSPVPLRSVPPAMTGSFIPPTSLIDAIQRNASAHNANNNNNVNNFNTTSGKGSPSNNVLVISRMGNNDVVNKLANDSSPSLSKVAAAAAAAAAVKSNFNISMKTNKNNAGLERTDDGDEIDFLNGDYNAQALLGGQIVGNNEWCDFENSKEIKNESSSSSTKTSSDGDNDDDEDDLDSTVTSTSTSDRSRDDDDYDSEYESAVKSQTKSLGASSYSSFASSVKTEKLVPKRGMINNNNNIAAGKNNNSNKNWSNANNDDDDNDEYRPESPRSQQLQQQQQSPSGLLGNDTNNARRNNNNYTNPNNPTSSARSDGSGNSSTTNFRQQHHHNLQGTSTPSKKRLRRSGSVNSSVGTAESVRVAHIAGVERAHRMQREAQILASLAHPNVIGFIDSFSRDSKKFLVLEYIDGGDLEKEIKRRREPQVRHFTIESCLFLWVQAVLAVEYLHRHNILHRDIKAANLLISKKWIVKLSDYGTSEQFDKNVSAEGTSNKVCGTPYCMAVEQFLVTPDGIRLPYSEKADVWSLGVVLWELVNIVAPPFVGSTVHSLAQRIVRENPRPMVRDNVPAPVMALLHRILDKDPKRRPTCREILNYDFIQAALNSYVDRYQLAVDAKGSTKMDKVWLGVLKEHAELVTDKKPPIAAAGTGTESLISGKQQQHQLRAQQEMSAVAATSNVVAAAVASTLAKATTNNESSQISRVHCAEKRRIMVYRRQQRDDFYEQNPHLVLGIPKTK